MRDAAICLLFFIASFSAKAQNVYNWQLQGFYGNYLTHKDIRTVPEKNHLGFSLDFFKNTDGRKYWQFAHNYPNMGLSLTVRSLGNDSVYGHAISLLPYLEFNAFNSRHGALQIKHGTGIAYVTRRYDRIINTQNKMLGTHLTATSILDVGYRFYLSTNWDLKFGGIIHHFSNGSFKTPNAGMNTGSLYSAISYYPFATNTSKIKHEPICDFKRWRYRLGTSVGFYDYQPEQGSIKLNTQLSGMGFYQHNTRFRTGLGFEAGRLTNKKPQTAIYMEEEVQFGNVATRYGFGGYVINKNERGADFYSKIGIAYYPKKKNNIPEKFYIGSLLKAHGFKAAHVELTAGYLF